MHKSESLLEKMRSIEFSDTLKYNLGRTTRPIVNLQEKKKN